MDKLRQYLNALSRQEQAEFALRCNTTINYLRKAISQNTRLGTELCVLIEQQSKNCVTRQDLIPDWEARWPELSTK
ncbi:Cro/Cl family transcriptional regulator [Pasteurellaceae bacterium HPA106]|uniref:Cro/Cl family transcriptional regulator n=1 Tax=Spirabiliibacterium pneumoniae TaxID=221400 RepID=UPI001AACE808|nr:Cro/Cl family transcriptional regulator [Spirabiliibacterium pneumoniae]MBE2895732.1 Cro/Cl family transcriptional regulator [Spirabiliibacterium pneumoniae]